MLGAALGTTSIAGGRLGSAVHLVPEIRVLLLALKAGEDVSEGAREASLLVLWAAAGLNRSPHGVGLPTPRLAIGNNGGILPEGKKGIGQVIHLEAERPGTCESCLRSLLEGLSASNTTTISEENFQQGPVHQARLTRVRSARIQSVDASRARWLGQGSQALGQKSFRQRPRD